MANASPRGGSEGEQLGSYRLVRKLGRGGMGEVWLAEHDTIKSQVAIKLVLAAPDDEDAASRFLREAKATARIRHPGVVTVSDFGPRPAGGAYLVMELLDGESLADRLERGALSSDLVIDLGLQMAEALAAAHASGVVHRDLKPANVFLVRDAAARSDVRVKLVDFGVAKATGKVTDELGVTRTGALVGTPVYMAPEQCTTRKGPVDARADLYALGVVVYEMLTGKPPFRGPTLGDLIDQHLNETPTTPRTVVPSIPAKLDVLVMTLLAKDRADRPASANEVARVLHELRGTIPSPVTLDETMGSGTRPAVRSEASVDETVASGARAKDSGTDATVASAASPGVAKAAVTHATPESRPVPRALLWGLVGGFVLFTVILVVIVLGRDRGGPPPAKPTDPVAACDQGDPKACITLADEEMKKAKPDLGRVFRLAQAACDRKELVACARESWMFQWGAGVTADLARARSLAVETCTSGNGWACEVAGDLTMDPVAAYALYAQGCEANDAGSCNVVGRRLALGLGTPVDAEKAKTAHERSLKLSIAGCDRNDARSCRAGGLDYARGDGVAIDAPRGSSLLLRACELGGVEACGEIGEMYALGAGGFAKDHEQSRRYLTMGCDRGGGIACQTLAIVIANGLIGPPDPQAGFEIAKRVCEERSPLACSILGNFYKIGTGTPPDVARARIAYERGCEAGDPEACVQVTSIVLPHEVVDQAKQVAALERSCDLGSGYGCKKLGTALRDKGDFAGAIARYEQACKLSDQQLGCQDLADAYFDGVGVTKDPAHALEILKQGCAAKAIVSCHVLGTWLRDGKGTPAQPADAMTKFDMACSNGWGASCVAQADLLESPIYGLKADPKRAAELRELACTLEPTKFCEKKKKK